MSAADEMRIIANAYLECRNTESDLSEAQAAQDIAEAAFKKVTDKFIKAMANDPEWMSARKALNAAVDHTDVMQAFSSEALENLNRMIDRFPATAVTMAGLDR